MSNIDNYKKYLKYKTKYLDLKKNQKGGAVCPLCKMSHELSDCPLMFSSKLPFEMWNLILLGGNLQPLDILSFYRTEFNRFDEKEFEIDFKRNIKKIYDIFKRHNIATHQNTLELWELFNAQDNTNNNNIYNMFSILWSSFLFVINEKNPFSLDPELPRLETKKQIQERETKESLLFLDYFEFAVKINLNTFESFRNLSNLDIYLLVSGFKVLYKNVDDLLKDVVNISNRLKNNYQLNLSKKERLFIIFNIDKDIEFLKKLRPLFKNIDDINFILRLNEEQLHRLRLLILINKIPVKLAYYFVENNISNDVITRSHSIIFDDTIPVEFAYYFVSNNTSDTEITKLLQYKKYELSNAIIFAKYNLNEEQIKTYLRLQYTMKPEQIINIILNRTPTGNFGSWWGSDAERLEAEELEAEGL
jgi:hypothetical protein